MTGQQDDEGARDRPEKPAGRHARLEQALRDNLLKRKAQSRARKGSAPPPKEGRQSRG